MPIKRIEQPKIINIDKGLRLRAFDGNYSFAAVWYNNPNTVLLVDGVFEPYSKEQLALMYDVLNKRSEAYFIEVKKENRFVPMVNVTTQMFYKLFDLREYEYRHETSDRVRLVGWIDGVEVISWL